jgi:Yip1-like protein
MPSDTPTNGFVMRLIGAISLDAAIYEEVEADRGGTGQALIVVVLASLATGIGARGFAQVTIESILSFSALALVGWATWALLTFEIGYRLMPAPQTRADVGQMLRTTGFASTPALFRVFGIMPGATIPVFAATMVWSLVAMVVAVRQALDYTSTGRAVAVCILGWALAFAIALVIGLFFGPTLS